MYRLLVAFLFLLTGYAAADDGRKYAAMSLLGDQIEVVFARMQTGAAVAPRNVHEKVPIPDATFDHSVLRELDRIVSARRGARPLTLLAAKDPQLFALQERLVETNAGIAELLEPIKKITDAQQVTHLLLVTKYRHDALLRLRSSSVGSGQLTGLGYYMDKTTGTRRADTMERGTGILAPYAYFRISLVDMRTLKILREDTGLASNARSAARAPDGVDPWQALTDTDKVRMLEGLLQGEIARILPPLLEE